MTKADALAYFKENILPGVRKAYEQDGQVDAIARREEWNNWTDMLCKDGTITSHQYNTWDNPF